MTFSSCNFSYMNIWLNVRRRSREINPMQPGNARFQREKSLAKTMFFLLGLAFITYAFPVTVFNVRHHIFRYV